VLWVVVVLVLALAGLVTLVCYAVWLAHKTADLLSEVAVLGDRAGELADLVGQIHAPGDARDVGGVEGTLIRGGPTYDER
jgi:hypothetical protein